MTRQGIVVVGSSNTDLSITLSRLPRAGETLLGKSLSTAPGGKGANQAVAAARAGGRVSLIARVGKDAMGDQAIDTCVNDGVDVTHVTRDRDAASGVAFILVAKNGENSIAVAAGANGHLSPAHIRKASASIGRAKVLLVQLEVPLETVQAAVSFADSKGAVVVLNPAPARALPASLLRRVSVLTPNESEAELLTGIRLNGLGAAEKAAGKLLRGGVRSVVLTLGSEGAIIGDMGGIRHIPAYKVKAVDTTAAGDVFNGALAVALSEGLSLHEAVRMANAAGALSVTHPGAQASAPTRAAINRFMSSR